MAVAPLEDDDFDLEDLQIDYQEACNDVVDLQRDLKATTSELNSLRVLLKADGCSREQVQAEMPNAVRIDPVLECRKFSELTKLFTWIAAHVDLSRTEIMEVGLQVPVGGRSALLERVTQWQMPVSPGQKLRFTVPTEHAEEMRSILLEARSQPVLSHRTLRLLAATWDLFLGDLTTFTRGSFAEPAMLLAQRFGPSGILIATWPTRESLEALQLLFDSSGGVPKPGDRVEVDYGGKRFTGTVHALDATGKVTVRCDADAPGVLTVAPFRDVRKLEQRTAVKEAATKEAAAAAVAISRSGPHSELLEKLGAPEDDSDGTPTEAPRRAAHRRTRSCM